MLRKYVFSQFTPFMYITLQNARNNDKLYPEIRYEIRYEIKKKPKKQNIVTEDKYVYYISINQTLCSVTMIGKLL